MSSEPNAAMDNADSEIQTSDVETTSSTTLVEISQGIVAVFGELPGGLQQIDLSLVPNFDREKIGSILSTVGSSAAVIGNASAAITGAKGLYRFDDATVQLLKNGAKLATKDGANLGSIFQNGKIVGQARLIPAGLTTAGAIASIGPAISMLALQAQLNEVSNLMQTNLAMTSQVLKTIREQQWSSMDGLSKTINKALDEVYATGAVPQTVWDKIASKEDDLRGQLGLYQGSVGRHIQELKNKEGVALRRYLDVNAEAIALDGLSMLKALQAFAGYQAIHASKSRADSIHDEKEGKLFDLIMSTVPKEIDISLEAVRSLIGDVTQELRVITDLPGKPTLPLSKRWRDTRASQQCGQQVLKILAPIADSLRTPLPELENPEIVCGPDKLDLNPYLKALRWYIEGDETVTAIAFPYKVSAHNLTGMIPKALEARVDATWKSLEDGRKADALSAVASSIFLCVTDRRIIVADPRVLRREGLVALSIPSADVKFIRTARLGHEAIRASLDIYTTSEELKLLFPADASNEQVVMLGKMIEALISSNKEAELELFSNQRGETSE